MTVTVTTENSTIGSQTVIPNLSVRLPYPQTPQRFLGSPKLVPLSLRILENRAFQGLTRTLLGNGPVRSMTQTMVDPPTLHPEERWTSSVTSDVRIRSFERTSLPLSVFRTCKTRHWYATGLLKCNIIQVFYRCPTGRHVVKVFEL